MQEIQQLLQAIYAVLYSLVLLAARGEAELRGVMAQEGINQSAQGVILISADLLLFCLFTYTLRGWVRAIAVFATILVLIHLLQLWDLTPGAREGWYRGFPSVYPRAALAWAPACKQLLAPICRGKPASFLLAGLRAQLSANRA
jgi:hypothetical protein